MFWMFRVRLAAGSLLHTMQEAPVAQIQWKCFSAAVQMGEGIPAFSLYPLAFCVALLTWKEMFFASLI